MCSVVLRSRPPPSSTLFPYTTLFRSRTSVRFASSILNRLCFCGRACSRAASAALRNVSVPALEPTSAFSARSEEHTSELQSHSDLVCRLLLEKNKQQQSE